MTSTSQPATASDPWRSSSLDLAGGRTGVAASAAAAVAGLVHGRHQSSAERLISSERSEPAGVPPHYASEEESLPSSHIDSKASYHVALAKSRPSDPPLLFPRGDAPDDLLDGVDAFEDRSSLIPANACDRLGPKGGTLLRPPPEPGSKGKRRMLRKEIQVERAPW